MYLSPEQVLLSWRYETEFSHTQGELAVLREPREYLGLGYTVLGGRHEVQLVPNIALGLDLKVVKIFHLVLI